MKIKLTPVGIGLAVIAIGLTAAATQQRSSPPSTASVADNLVNRSANIRQGEQVWITGGARDQELLEDIAVDHHFSEEGLHWSC